MAAARLPQLRAILAEGGYGDFGEGVLGSGTNSSGVARFFEFFLLRSFKHSYRWLTGVDINQLSPLGVIGQVAPRPILLIYGSREVSLAGAYQQQAAAGDTAELWIVEGAGHGAYFDVAPEEYEAKLVTFFDKSLLKEN
jgi:pimeloyl-ACP methyl ester carboxylesterase